MCATAAIATMLNESLVPFVPVRLIWQSCCGYTWVGADRAHCCRRTGGCGYVFDDAELWDAHRDGGACGEPRTLNLVQTKNGIWMRALDHATG